MERLLTLYSEVQSTDVRWLWYPFIAIGKITLLQGDPGDGKSSMMMNLIAELSTGGKTPDGCKIGAPQKVIYQCSEDGVSDTIKPRLERCGADCGKIAFINEEVYNGLTLDDERILSGIVYNIARTRARKAIQIKKILTKYIEWSGIYLVFDYIVRYSVEGTRTKHELWNEVVYTISFYGV